MRIITVCPESFAANTYLLISGNEAIVVDPAVSVSALQSMLKSENAELRAILLTHGHFDHTVSVDRIRNESDIPLMIHSADASMLTDGKTNAFYDFYGRECIHRPAEACFEDGERIKLGDKSIRVIHTPGHSPGSVCFLCPDGDTEFLITGDTLFSNSIGRCDLWGGSEMLIAESLKKLSSLNKKMTIYPGHGPSYTLGAALDNAAYYL